MKPDAAAIEAALKAAHANALVARGVRVEAAHAAPECREPSAITAWIDGLSDEQLHGVATASNATYDGSKERGESWPRMYAAACEALRAALKALAVPPPEQP